ncbi:MAG: hypothetical protein ACYTFG_22215 [Planctomycetota bacterium]|jgi:response regulator RpfG family c-di-GMP phosphodiesterase
METLPVCAGLGLNVGEAAAYRTWFLQYVQKQITDSLLVRTRIQYKVDHTDRVCRNILAIGEALKLEQGLLCLAEVLALFHDLGRFEQITKYNSRAWKATTSTASPRGVPSL